MRLAVPATIAGVNMPRLRLAAASLVALATLGACTAPGSQNPLPGQSAAPTAGGRTATASPTPTPPRILTLEDLAPGLQKAPAAFSNPAPAVAEPGPALAVSLAAEASTKRFDQGSLGLSFEATELADDRWDPAKSYLDELVGALDRPSLRFGGNSVDRRMWWTSTDEPAPEWAEVTLTPADFTRLATFVTKTGASVTLVVDLGHNDPARAADMVFHARRSLGDRLIAVSIGNEPNGFALASQPQYRMREDGYSPAQFVAEARPYVEAIHAKAPEVGIVGPGTFDAPWWRAFADAGFPHTRALSQHWYPLWSCDGSAEPKASPTVANITSPWLHERATFIIGMGLQTARRYDLPLWMEETGPTSCAGTNDSSRTHAQALWTADFTLHAAALGVERLNHHSMIDACRGGAPMSPVCDTGSLGSRSPVLNGQSNYLALLQLARLREGVLRPVRVSGAEGVYGYAVEDDKGLDLVLVNLNDPAAVGASALEFAVPEGLTPTHGSVLWADTLDVRNGTSLLPWSKLDAVPATVNAGSVLAVKFQRA